MILLLLLISESIQPDSILRIVDSRLAVIKTINGEIRREVSVSRAGRFELIGKFYLVVPSKLRIDFAVPEEQTFTTDGRLLWVYTPQKKELLTRNVANIIPIEKQSMGAMMDFGSSIAQVLSKGYELKIDYQGKLVRYNVWVIRGVARDTMVSMQKILLWIDKDNFMVRRFESYGKKGNLFGIYLVEKERMFENELYLPVQYEIRVGTKDGLMRIRNYLSLVEINKDIPESLFARPVLEEDTVIRAPGNQGIREK